MSNVRVIARLDIKGLNVIKGVHLEGLRIIGSPSDFAKRYYDQGIDELIYMDSVASLYGRNNLIEIIRQAAAEIFVPLTVGGGIRSVADAQMILRAGADKVAVNTGAVLNPNLISEISRTFGSQCLVLSVEAKSIGPNKWEALTANGRERTGLDVVEWVKKAVNLGAGEILLTSIDKEGTGKGFDLPLVKAVTNCVNVPVIASGGMGSAQDLIDVVRKSDANAVAIAMILHYNKVVLSEVRDQVNAAGIKIRIA